jgi:hypothetical protein
MIQSEIQSEIQIFAPVERQRRALANGPFHR